MSTITVQQQLDILSKSGTIPTNLFGDGMLFSAIFATPEIDMSPTVIDIQGRQWEHIDGSYYYKLPTGSSCPIFFINRYK
tara:strand:- start:520 stop:759 length:240 start_codon:yes stop_codon:yes gene_type:complete